VSAKPEITLNTLASTSDGQAIGDGPGIQDLGVIITTIGALHVFDVNKKAAALALSSQYWIK
jgi:hypothetical protein